MTQESFYSRLFGNSTNPHASNAGAAAGSAVGQVVAQRRQQRRGGFLAETRRNTPRGSSVPPPVPANIRQVAEQAVAAGLEGGRRNSPSRFWQYAGQVPAGALQSTVANSATPQDDQDYARIEQLRRDTFGPVIGGIMNAAGNLTGGSYRPAAVDNPTALVGLVRALFAPATGLDTQSEEFQNSSFGQRGLDRSRIATTRVNDALGINDPENIFQLGLNVAGGMAVPTRTIPITAATTAGRALQRVGRVGAELLIPFRQTSFPLATAIGTGVAGTLTETVDAIADDPNYTGIVDVLGRENILPRFDGTDGPQSNETLTIDDVVDDVQPEQEAPLSMDDVLNDVGGEVQPVDDAPALSIDDVVADRTGMEQTFARTPEDDDDDWLSFNTFRNAAITVGAAFGARHLIRRLRSGTASAVTRLGERASGRAGAEGLGAVGDATAAPPLRGTTRRRSRQGTVSAAISAVADQNRPIRDAAEEFLGRDYARSMGWSLDTMTNTAVGARVMDFLRTGRGPGTAQRYTRLGPVLEGYGRELAPDQQQLVDDAILAARAIDDLDNTGVQSAFTRGRDGQPITPQQLRELVTRVRNDPVMSRYFNAGIQSGRDMLDFMTRRGLLSAERAQEWSRLRPHWAPFNRSLEFDRDLSELLGTRYSSNRSAVSMNSTELEGASVQGGAVAGPFQGIVDRWANLIRFAEENDVRVRFLRDMNGLASPGQKPIVRRLGPNSRDRGDEVHTVLENGQRVHYRVTDPAINKALHFTPRATWQAFETTRQVMQNLTTGPLGTLVSGFAALKSPMYDAVLGSMLEPKNLTTGFINEQLLRATGGRASLGGLDPTRLASGYIGAVRYMWDSLKGEIGNRLEASLMRNDSIIRSVLGDQNAGALAQVFTNAYENSIKSLMDQMGVSSHTIHGAPDAARPITNISDIAPSFERAIARQVYDEARRDPNATMYERLLRNPAQSAYARARSGNIARAYGAILESMHNGYRYQALATARRQRGFAGKMQERAAQLRRLSADASRHGGSDGINIGVGSFMYGNLAIQSMYEVGHLIRRDPIQFTTNLMMTTLPIIALHQLALANDPFAAEIHANKSPQQRAASITTFGGAEIPLDPLARVFMYPLIAAFEHMSGTMAGDPNIDLLSAFDRMLGDEDFNAELGLGMENALRGINPVAMSNSPFGAMGLAAMGADVTSARVGGEARPVRTQTGTAFDSDMARQDALATAYTENWIRAVTGQFGATMYEIIDDFNRSFLRTNDVGESLERARERYVDNLHRGAALARPLFGQYEHLQAVGDLNWQQYNAAREGVELATRMFQRDVQAPGMTGMREGYALQGDSPVPDLANTEASYIGSMANLLQRDTADARQRLAALGRQTESLRSNAVTPRQETNRQLNEITEQRQEITLYLLLRTRDYERAISERLGREFSFDGFRPEEYTNSLTPVPIAPQ